LSEKLSPWGAPPVHPVPGDDDRDVVLGLRPRNEQGPPHAQEDDTCELDVVRPGGSMAQVIRGADPDFLGDA
jgi:hypothetical protein